MVRYWRVHAAIRATVDPATDPSGFGNVCHAGVPLWLNEHYARGQRFVFDRLLRRVPPVTDQLARALDVGCGTGRWSAQLALRGYSTVGIDLQPSLIEADQIRYPEIRFYCVPLQDFDSTNRFDLISSVTVLQHIPHDEQSAAIRSIARLLNAGGYVIMLENTSDQGPHVFANTSDAWIQKFKNEGLSCIHTYRYDYNPALRAIASLQRIRPRSKRPAEAPETYATRRQLRRALSGAWWIAVQIDSLADPVLVGSQVPIQTKHCGFLFTN